ncbi:MAG TPA: hypothetical protein VIN08_10015 [Ohtaekwangia sp.]|uniref:hypothetical protein n=1 Tax=Ohtaekwangia sp. TaxID=2066019 RepID=UPI002F93EE1B
MTFDDFKTSLNGATPPQHLSNLLQALWYEGKGDWEAAHNIAQDIHSNDGSWIHAYLHRVEGDLGNASYWYSRANRKMPVNTLKEEWRAIAEELLARK